MEQLIEIFDLKETNSKPPAIIKKSPQEVNLDISSESIIATDLQKTRENIDELIDLGKEALKQAINFGEISQHSRWYDAIGSILSSLTTINQQYIDTHEKISKIKKNYAEIGLGKQPSSINVDKAVFVGTAADLLNEVKPRITEK